jgi:hypothetical protein
MTEYSKTYLQLPLPPSKNKRLGFAHGRFYITNEVKNYYNEISQIIRFQYRINKLFVKQDKLVI